jgi:F0F1-type ATP synthase membrane subunit a
LKHLAGPIWWIAPLIFPIELISNLIRPFSLGIRLFGNLFADEKVLENLSGLAPPYNVVCADRADAAERLRGFDSDVCFHTALAALHQRGVARAASCACHGEHGEEEYEGDEFIAPVLT